MKIYLRSGQNGGSNILKEICGTYLSSSVGGYGLPRIGVFFRIRKLRFQLQQFKLSLSTQVSQNQRTTKHLDKIKANK